MLVGSCMLTEYGRRSKPAVATMKNEPLLGGNWCLVGATVVSFQNEIKHAHTLLMR